MNVTPIAAILAGRHDGQDLAVGGWLRTRRDSKGGFSFLELNDGSCLANLQVIAAAELTNYTAEILALHPGACLHVRGRVTPSPGAEQSVELHAETVTVLGDCPVEGYPLQKKRISLERLREIAHLRVRTNTFGAVARVRNALAFATHRFFQERGFLYLNTPIITASDCEGAGEMFRVSTLPADAPPRDDEGAVDFTADFFAREAKLTVSGQLEAETYACGMSKVYTFGPTFRAENSNTSRHLAEFWMVEPEIAFADLADDADLAEDYLRFLLTELLEHHAEDLGLFNQWIDKGLIDRLEKVAQTSFERLPYGDAVHLLEHAGRTFEYPVSWGVDLQSEHERYLTEEVFHAPVIVMDFPREIKAFYMRANEDGRTVASMDVLVPQIGEIIGGSQREERLDCLEARLRAQALAPEDYWWYLDLRRFGTVPHAGFGLGFERLVQFATGMSNIRDVIPYPRTPRHADF